MQPRLIAIDMDGTLLNSEGRVTPRTVAALLAADRAGMEIVISTGRRHSYAMRVLRALNLNPESALVSSNGTVIRTIGSDLLHRTYLARSTARWLCAHLQPQVELDFLLMFSGKVLDRARGRILKFYRPAAPIPRVRLQTPWLASPSRATQPRPPREPGVTRWTTARPGRHCRPASATRTRWSSDPAHASTSCQPPTTTACPAR